MRLASLVSLAFLVACSGGTKAPASNPPATSAAPPASANAPEPERKNDAGKYLKSAEEAGEPAQRARVSASALSEEQFELPTNARKVLSAISGESVNPSQAARIIVQLVEEEPAAQETRFVRAAERIGARIAAEVQKLAPPKRTEMLVAMCKVEAGRLGDAKTRDKLNFAAVILSVVLEKLLEKRGGISEAERKLARHVAQLQRLDSKP